MKKSKDSDTPLKTPKQSNKLSLFYDLPTLEFSFNREVVIEGCKGVVHYSDELIRINTDKGLVSFEGRGLNLKCISFSAIIISGFILKVEFML